MTPPHLHIIGVDPGGTTGWVRVTVPRGSVYGNQESQVLDWEWGEFYGNEDIQVRDLCRLAREVQSLDYLIGPAFVVEDFDVSKTVNTDTKVLYSPIRIAAKLEFAIAAGLAGDSRITLQTRGMAKSTVTDDRLQRWGYWIEGSDHARDAMRHAITAIRRAKASEEFRCQMWNNGFKKEPVLFANNMR